MSGESVFREIAPPYMHKLIQDFPVLDRLDAAAVFGNFGHESAGFTKLQETRPTVQGSRGGYGWAQWTGPRRRAYEAYCQRNGKDPSAPDSNYAYVFVELTGPEARAIGALTDARTLYEKVEAFERSFERAGVKHYASRKQWSLVALEAYEAWLEAQGGELPTAPGEQLPAPISDDLTTIEAISRLSEMDAGKLERIANAVALARAIQSGWAVTDGTAAKSITTESIDMNGAKNWFKSKGVMGGVAAVAALIGPIFGLDLGQTNINDTMIAINELVAAVGALVAIYGRITAKAQISK